MTWDDIHYFQPHEFDSRDEPGSGAKHMNLDFVHLLDAIRGVIGKPLVINSGYRSPAHNAAVGGVKNSAHMRGLAVDIRTNGDWILLYKILTVAIGFDVRRIGIQKRAQYIHIDIDRSLPEPRVWFYD